MVPPNAADANSKGIGMVFQEQSLLTNLTVGENIYLGNEPRRGPFTDKTAMRDGAEKLFEELGFPIDVRRPVVSLSRAEQQMTEIAKAIHSQARILILDEPTASLNTEIGLAVMQLLAEQRDQRSVVMVTHDDRMARFATRTILLRDGEIVADGAPQKAAVH